MNLDDLRALARAEHIADTEPLTVTAYNLRRLVASHDALADELGRLKAAIEPDAQAREIGRALGVLEAATHVGKLAREHARAANREREDRASIPFRAAANALWTAAQSLREDGTAARDRSRWADTDALGPTIKGWVEAHGSERVINGARAASDRQLVAALFDYRTAQGERDGLDARLVDVLREVESRLWRANGGAFEADERDRVLDELSLEASESRPELRAGEAARYLARWGREPCLSDCACPECVPRGAEVERLRAALASAERRAERLQGNDPTRHPCGRVPDDVAALLAGAGIELRVMAVTEWHVGAAGADCVRVAENVTVVARRRGAVPRDGCGAGVGEVRAATLAALGALSRRHDGAATATRGHAERKSAETDRLLTHSIADGLARWAQEAAAVRDAVDAAWPEVRP